MTSNKVYSIQEVYGLHEQFKTMITEVVTHLLSLGSDHFPTQSKMFFVDGNEFEFKFKPNQGLTDLLYLTGKETPAAAKIAGAHFLSANGYVISTDMGDYENGVSDEALDMITAGFVDIMVANMARVYFREQMATKVTAALDEKEFDVITELSNGLIHSAYTRNGFSVTLYDGNGDILLKDLSNARHPTPRSDYIGRCYRHTEVAFQLAIGARLICTEDWKVSIQHFPRV